MLGLKEEFEERLLIPIPSSNWQIVAKVRASRTLQEAVRQVATGPYGPQIERATSGRKDEEAISAIELELRRHIAGVCKTAFSGAPFNAGLILGFALLREFEMGDLVAIVTGRKAGMGNERLKELLVAAA
jgi:vacuolar-type H+-ATPase subunit C/Vma6